MKLIVKYQLSNSYRQQQFANANAVQKMSELTIELPPPVPFSIVKYAQLDESGQIATLDMVNGYGSMYVNRVTETTKYLAGTPFRVRELNSELIKSYSSAAVFDAPLTTESLLAAFADQALSADDIAFNAKEEEQARIKNAARDAKEDEKQAIIAETKKKNEAIKEQQQKERGAFIASWVRAHGTASQKERFAEGLLAESEIADTIKTSAFSNITAAAFYTPLKRSDIEHDGDCCDNTGETRFEKEPAGSATESEYNALKAVRAQLSANQEAELVTHSATCRDCAESAVRSSIKVTATVGPFTFNRDFSA